MVESGFFKSGFFLWGFTPYVDKDQLPTKIMSHSYGLINIGL